MAHRLRNTGIVYSLLLSSLKLFPHLILFPMQIIVNSQIEVMSYIEVTGHVKVYQVKGFFPQQRLFFAV